MHRARVVVVGAALALTGACGTILHIDPDEPTTTSEAGAGDEGRTESGDAYANVTPCATGPMGDCVGNVLTKQRGMIDAIAADDAFVYYASRSGRVARIPLDGQAELEYATNAENAVGIAVDAEYVYVAANTGSPGVARIRKDGTGAREIIEPCAGARGVAVYGGTAFWLASCGDPYVGSKDLDSGASLMIAIENDASLAFGPGARDGHIAVDDSGIYFATAATIRTLSRDFSGSTRTVSNFANSGDQPLGVAIDADGIYVRANSAAYVISKTQTSTGAIDPKATVEVMPPESPASDRSGVAVDATHVYFASSAKSEVLRFSKGGSTSFERVASDNGGPLAIALAGPYVYWSNKVGEIRRAPKPPP